MSAPADGEGNGQTDPADQGRERGQQPRQRAPNPEPGADDDDDGGWKLFVRDVLSSVLAVALVGVYLFAISGVWPPMVAVESGSMLPNMERNDLVFVMEEERFAGEGAKHGVVTARVGAETGYTKFNNPGDVVVYAPDGNVGQTPIIHRAMFWVENGENWVDPPSEGGTGKANPRYLAGGRTTCDEVTHCPAPNDGFITKGDNNGNYDQVTSIRSCEGNCNPVRPGWVTGTAELRIGGLGWIRLNS